MTLQTTDELDQAISMLAVYAVRYALDRKTYAVPETCAAVKRLGDRLSSFAANQIVEAIDTVGDRGDLGFEEASEWLALRDELRRRE